MAFKEVLGQKQATEILRKALREEKVAQTYLFVGPEGVGKKLTAISLVQALNCKVEPLEGCGVCEVCRNIKELNHPDVFYLKPEGTWYKIQQIREITREAYLKPYISKWKVFILDDAHQLRTESANALLKILEEPPQFTIFILIACHPELLLPTIISRSQIVSFSYLNEIEIESIIKDKVLEERFEILVTLAQGSVGKAIFWNEEDNWRRRLELFKYLTLLKKERAYSPFDIADFLAEEKDEEKITSYLELVLFWWRDLFFWKLTKDDRLITQKDFLPEIIRKSQEYSLKDLREFFRLTQDTIKGIRNNANLLLTLETLFLRVGVGS
ncbi:MAG TPA: DNA polymerase III subunit delta' [Dictyoglomaceae bacterium]|nr:DNA polymerase III subunit delta' [Dictyoglomaceae bacterium]HOL39714.1 DNA polymerase III subunit delta' [Dictyoglomaceae bacterium]HOP95472.1 DNA polymerase III subunit delta' [Dictyoglomaceae bacterium]HPP16153.1 DNA polymerase III subunit delta' [Dictyoglomaceae bacterium]HPU43761.1 DNA polymerase III subunit delta' [Dictyoglomaceae bacterium]